MRTTTARVVILAALTAAGCSTGHAGSSSSADSGVATGPPQAGQASCTSDGTLSGTGKPMNPAAAIQSATLAADNGQLVLAIQTVGSVGQETNTGSSIAYTLQLYDNDKTDGQPAYYISLKIDDYSGQNGAIGPSASAERTDPNAQGGEAPLAPPTFDSSGNSLTIAEPLSELGALTDPFAWMLVATDLENDSPSQFRAGRPPDEFSDRCPLTGLAHL